MNKTVKIIIYIAASAWVVKCIQEMIVHFGKNSIGDYIGAICMMVLPVVFIIWLIKDRERKYNQFIDKRRKEENDRIERINSLQYNLPVLEVPSLHLGNVQVHYYGQGSLLETENKMVGMVSRSHQEIKERPSFFESSRHRNYYSNGSEQSQALYDNVSSLYQGEVVITDRSVIFINPQEGFEIKIQDIAVTDEYNDGVSIQSGVESYQILLEDPKYFIAILDVLRER